MVHTLGSHYHWLPEQILSMSFAAVEEHMQLVAYAIEEADFKAAGAQGVAVPAPVHPWTEASDFGASSIEELKSLRKASTSAKDMLAKLG